MEKSINSQDESELYDYLTFPTESLTTNNEIQSNIILKPLQDQLLNSDLTTQYIIIQDSNQFLNNNDFRGESNFILEPSVVELESIVASEENPQDINVTNTDLVDETVNVTTVTKPPTNSSIKCSLCDKTFKKLTQYRLHMQEHRNMKKFKCNLCFESYNIENNFKIHMAMHSKGEPNCPICDRKFQRLASLKSHLLLHQVDETFTCTECLAEFEKEDDLNSHLETHQKEFVEVKTNDIPLVCSYCNYLFYDTDKYKEHLVLHIKAKRMVNESKRTKRKHHVNPKALQFKCEFCQKGFAKLCLLERHRRIHTGEKPFICHICNKGFSQNGTLQIHLNRHNGKKPFECIFCSAKFSQKGNLRIHLEKTHTAGAPGEKNYKCNHCTCIFKKISSLNGHITKFHSNALQDGSVNITEIIDQLKELDKQTKPADSAEKRDVTQSVLNTVTNSSYDTYVKIADTSVDGVIRRYLIKQRKYGDAKWYICSHCNKEFKKPSDLIRHIRIHTNEKPFKCTECGQRFAQKSTLLNHSKTHSKNLSKCLHCGKVLSSDRTLSKHLKLHEKSSTHDESLNQTQKPADNIKDLLFMKENKTYNLNIIMKQPIVETESGLYSVAPPKPRTPYATLEQYRNRPFKCNICNAAFLKTMHLKRHMQTHIGVKNFECELCQKSFFTQYGLKEHMNHHTKIKNHVCKTCGKRFYTKNCLKRHLPQHSVLKPFICPYCKKRFKQDYLCRRHIRRHKIDLQNSILALNETGELQFDPEKIVQLTDENVVVEELQENITYNNISTVEHKVQSKDVFEDVSKSFAKLESNVPDVNKPAINEVKENELILSNISLEDNNTNGIQYPMYITTEDLQMLNNSNIVNALLPQLKLQNTDPLLLSSINELQDTNILYPLDAAITADEQTFPNDNQSYDTFNDNIIFNQNINELNLNAGIESDGIPKEHVVNQQNELELNKIDETQRNVINEQLIILNAQKSNDLEFINFPQSDFIDINSYNLNETCKIMDGTSEEVSDNYFQCNICKFKFKTMNDYSKHECKSATIIDGNKINLDETSNNNNNNNNNNNDNNNTRNGEQPEALACQHCGKKFQAHVVLLRHISSKHKETVDNKCKFCAKQFKKRSDFIRHLRTHTGEKPFSCEKCDKRFSLKSTLMSHLRTHNPVPNKEFKCHVCGTYFSCKSSLKKHIMIHTDIKPFSCDLCSLKFRSAQHKKSHMQKHERDKMREQNAAAKTNKINLLQSILLENKDNQIFDEGLNEEIFYQSEDHIELEQATQNLLSSELPIDENVELNENVQVVPLLLQLQSNSALNFQFSLDGQILNVKQNDSHTIEATNSHLEGVDNEKFDIVEGQTKNTKVQCDICLKYYVSKSVLNKHKRLLHGKHKCEKCNKAFDTKELLDKHSRLHYGLRPYLCPYCANSFAEEASLKVHIKRIHKSAVS